MTGDMADVSYRHIGQYLWRPDIRKLIGVDPALPVNFSGCSWDTRNRMVASLDHFNPTQHYIGALLDRGIRVLLYIGANYWMCNWVCLLSEKTGCQYALGLTLHR